MKTAMPLFRQPTIIPGADEFLTPEDIAHRRLRRRLWAAIPAVLLLGASLWFGAGPVFHRVRAWQARRAAEQARQMIAQGRWADAKERVTDALQLWPQEPAAIGAAALFLTRVGNNAQAAAFWKELAGMHPLTAEDNRGYAEAELGLGDVAAAEAPLHEAWPAGQPGTPADWLLGMQLALRRNNTPEAIGLAKRLLASPDITARQRLNCALVLLSSSSREDQNAAWQQIRTLAQEDESAESLDALLMLARRAAAAPAQADAASPPAGPLNLPLPSLAEVIARIEAHPLAKVQHRLLALDLRMAQDPGSRAALIQSAIDKYASGDPADLAALAGWLYAKGEFQKVLDVIPIAKALTDRALFFQYLDTLGALDRWNEIKELIVSQKYPLDPMIAQMYLARCADKLGESQEARDLHWKAALDAAGNHVDNLLMLGRYAEKNGAAGTAEAAFRVAVQADQQSRQAHEELILLLESRGETRALRDALQVMAGIWPRDPAVRNDLAYFDALLDENLTAARDTASELVAAEPASLPHRTTLALAELRLGDNFAALDALSGLGPMNNSVQPRSRAVAAAVLWAASYEQEAKQALAGLPLASLLPEERELVRPIEESESAPPAKQ